MKTWFDIGRHLQGRLKFLHEEDGDDMEESLTDSPDKREARMQKQMREDKRKGDIIRASKGKIKLKEIADRKIRSQNKQKQK